VDIYGVIYGKTGFPLAVRVVAGYPSVTADNDQGVSTTLAVHWALAHAFLPGYFPNATVDHKDNDSENYNFENLQWLTQQENTEKDQGKPVIATLEDGSEEEYKSISRAARFLGRYAANISACCLGKQAKSLKRRWRYV